MGWRLTMPPAHRHGIRQLSISVGLVGMLLVFAQPVSAAVPYADIASTGPLTHVYVGNDLSCQVHHEDDGSTGEVYPPGTIPGDCGTMLAVSGASGSQLFTPDFSNHGGTATSGLGARTPFTPVSQSLVTGSGAAGSPYQVVTVADAGTTGLRITQTDSYVVGEESYRTDIQVSYTGVSARSVVLYRAADCYLGGSDSGFGIVDPTTKSVGCREAVYDEIEGVYVPGDRIEQWVPITGGNNYYQAGYSEVWSQIGTHAALADSCECDQRQDNGAGISWNATVPAGGLVTLSHITTFSPSGVHALTMQKTADSASAPAGGTNGYTILVHNPNEEAVNVDSITDTLPAGFVYVSGSTTGATTSDPVGGTTLTWTGPFPVSGGGDLTLHFAVNVNTQPGEYMNQATAQAGSLTVVPTGPTAAVTVTPMEEPPPPVALPCDPVTLEGTGAGETLLGSDGTDRIRGLAGRDRIDVLAGDDEACGGLGGDYLYGRDGIDTLRGEEGNDRLYGGRHGDVMDGSAGHDAFLGGRGDDTILAADGTKDCIVSGRGDDSVAADPGLDLVDPPKGCPAGFWL